MDSLDAFGSWRIRGAGADCLVFLPRGEASEVSQLVLHKALSWSARETLAGLRRAIAGPTHRAVGPARVLREVLEAEKPPIASVVWLNGADVALDLRQDGRDAVGRPEHHTGYKPCSKAVGKAALSRGWGAF